MFVSLSFRAYLKCKLKYGFYTVLCKKNKTVFLDFNKKRWDLYI